MTKELIKMSLYLQCEYCKREIELTENNDVPAQSPYFCKKCYKYMNVISDNDRRYPQTS